MAKKSAQAGRGLKTVSSQALEAELRRRERGVGKLVRQHAKMLRAIAELEARIRDQGGALSSNGSRNGVRHRPRNESNLIDALAAVLKGTTMSVTEVAEAVQEAGYKTTSDNFRTIVNQALIKSDKFKKVARGQYTAK
jgi:hypothetical protein